MNILKTLIRVYTNDIESTIKFYESLFNLKVLLRFKMEDAGLELASVSNILIISGTDESLKPFINTNATFLVDSISEYKKLLLSNNCKILKDIAKVPTGFNMTVSHPDGLIIEYVEHDKKYY